MENQGQVEKTNVTKNSNVYITVGVIILVGATSTASYFLGRNSIKPQQTIIAQPTIVPTSIVVTTIPSNQPGSPTTTPIFGIISPPLSEMPKIGNTTITVPSDWKKYTAEDPDIKVKTTLSMPPGYSFRFTGSDFLIQNDSDATELWKYETSIQRNETGNIINSYDGGSRRVWYEKYMAEQQKYQNIKDKIISVNEVPLNDTSYLAITVETPNYDDHGTISGTKKGIHYVYVQNGIAHIIKPNSIKSYTQSANIPQYISSIFASLSSSHQ